MKNTLVTYIITIFIVILLVELTNIGFFLMNQPDSYLFYLGLLLIGIECFIVGWYMIKELTKIFTSDEKKSEENDGIKK